MERPCFRIISETGEMYALKRTGPKTDPCGTPKLRIHGSERFPWMLTRDDHPVRYERIHWWATPDRWNRDCSSLSSPSWSTVSKAAVRSIAQPKHHDARRRPIECLLVTLTDTKFLIETHVYQTIVVTYFCYATLSVVDPFEKSALCWKGYSPYEMERINKWINI